MAHDRNLGTKELTHSKSAPRPPRSRPGSACIPSHSHSRLRPWPLNSQTSVQASDLKQELNIKNKLTCWKSTPRPLGSRPRTGCSCPPSRSRPRQRRPWPPGPQTRPPSLWAPAPAKTPGPTPAGPSPAPADIRTPNHSPGKTNQRSEVRPVSKRIDRGASKCVLGLYIFWQVSVGPGEFLSLSSSCHVMSSSCPRVHDVTEPNLSPCALVTPASKARQL
jgi:hypothetical protein